MEKYLVKQVRTAPCGVARQPAITPCLFAYLCALPSRWGAWWQAGQACMHIINVQKGVVAFLKLYTVVACLVMKCSLVS